MAEVMTEVGPGLLAPGSRASYVLAGNATFTVRNPETGQRFTLRLVRPEETESQKEPPWFAYYLNGPDNSSSFAYLGMVPREAEGKALRLVRTKASKATPEAPVWRALAWLLAGRLEDSRVEVWHEGSCGRCGRKLTVPESVATGLGPVCAQKGLGE